MLIFCLILKESHPVSVLGRLQSETSAGPLAAGLTGEPQTRLSGTVRPPARSCQTPPTNGLPQQVRHSFVAYHKAAHHLVCDANCRGSPRRRVPPRRAAAAATASAAVRGAGHTTRPIPQRASTPSQSHPPPLPCLANCGGPSPGPSFSFRRMTGGPLWRASSAAAGHACCSRGVGAHAQSCRTAATPAMMAVGRGI